MTLIKNREKSLVLILVGMLFVLLMAGRAYADDADFNISNGTLVKYSGNESTVTVPDSVTKIGENAFVGCTNMVKVELPETITAIDKNAFYSCKSLVEITLPSKLGSIGEMAFAECSALKSIVVPDTVTSLGTNIFNGCSSLTEVQLPKGLKSVPEATFAHCSSLASINLPSGVTSIGISAFLECKKLTTIALPAGVDKIGMYAFNSCTSLERIVIPDGVKNLEERCFTGCSKLVFVGLPTKLEKIYQHVFEGCSSLTTISFPKTVTAIGEGAFYKCTKLGTVYYAGSQAQWNKVTIRQGADIHTGISNENSALVSAKKIFNKSTYYFNDVLAGKYYSASIKYLFDKGAMTGLNASKFGVGTKVDRGMVVTILYKMEGQPAVDLTAAPFPDVAVKKWYAPACAWAKVENVTTGYKNGNFGPTDSVTRQDFMTFIYRYAQYKNYDVTVKSATTYKEKKDSGLVSGYARTAVNWGVELGLIGLNTDKINPRGEISRQDAAAIVARFLQNYEK